MIIRNSFVFISWVIFFINQTNSQNLQNLENLENNYKNESEITSTNIFETEETEEVFIIPPSPTPLPIDKTQWQFHTTRGSIFQNQLFDFYKNNIGYKNYKNIFVTDNRNPVRLKTIPELSITKDMDLENMNYQNFELLSEVHNLKMDYDKNKNDKTKESIQIVQTKTRKILGLTENEDLKILGYNGSVMVGPSNYLYTKKHPKDQNPKPKDDTENLYLPISQKKVPNYNCKEECQEKIIWSDLCVVDILQNKNFLPYGRLERGFYKKTCRCTAPEYEVITRFCE